MFLFTLKIFCVVNFLLFSVIIFFKSKKLDLSFVVFGYFLLGKGLTLSSNLMMGFYNWQDTPVFYYIGVVLNSFLFFYAPFLYFFALSFIKGSIIWRLQRFHFIPFLIFFVLSVIALPLIYLFPDISLSMWVLKARNYFNQLYFFQVIIYSVLALWFLYKNKLDNKRHIKISNWFKTIITVFLLIWFVFLISDFLYGTVSESITTTLSAVGTLLLLILSNLTLIFLISQPQYFYNNLSIKLSVERTDNLITKKNYDNLCELVMQEGIFKNADLKVGDLASKMGLSSRNISNLISTFNGGNFYDFINIYRINEAKRLLSLYEDDVTILTILYESGFNSKSVFNTTFKKIVGVTPSVYRKNHMSQKYG